MSDIAARAGVSRATVSLVLNRRHVDLRISEATRERVLQVAAELGYSRNELARAVVTGQSRVLGLLSAAPESESSARILSGAVDEAEAQGYFVKVLRGHNDLQEDAATLGRCLEMRLSGVLALYLRAEVLELVRAEMARHFVPVAVADDADGAQKSGIHVLSDYALGMEQAVSHLAELGHRRIALLTALETWNLGLPERARAFRAALKRHGLRLPSHFVLRAFPDAARTEAATRELLALAQPPTAFVCGTDTSAMVAERAARAVGLSVPRDLSVVGLGNPRVAEWADPPLTLVQQPFYEMGRSAMRHLLSRLPASDLGQQPFVDPLFLERLPTELVVRASTALAPKPPHSKGVSA